MKVVGVASGKRRCSRLRSTGRGDEGGDGKGPGFGRFLPLPPAAAGAAAVALASALASSVALSSLSSSAAPTGEVGGRGLPLFLPSRPHATEIEVFDEVLSDLERDYVSAVNVAKLTERAIAGMTSTLDPYTEFFQSGSANSKLEEAIMGRYEGEVGLLISRGGVGGGGGGESSPLRVEYALEGYSWEEGMRPGDRILEIDHIRVESLTTDEARALLRGVPGSTVTLTFLRDAPGAKGSEPREAILSRKVVRLPDLRVSTLLRNSNNNDGSSSVGYVKLSGFGKGLGAEVAAAISKMQQETTLAGGRLSALLLDLRGNPGGLLESAVEVAALFLPQDSDIVSAQGRSFPRLQYQTVSGRPPLLDPAITRLVVLTDGGSASASEILAGAIQDHDRGVIVGTGNTRGKGLVQSVTSLPSGSALKYTVAFYYTPSGRCIQSVKYSSSSLGGGGESESGSFQSFVVPEKDRKIFHTDRGRVVRDGGGIEPDVLVSVARPSNLQTTLTTTGSYYDYAGLWAKSHEFNGISDAEPSRATMADFKKWFLLSRDQQGGRRAAVTAAALTDLGIHDAVLRGKLVPILEESIAKQIDKDFTTDEKEIREDLRIAILARFVPDSILLKEELRGDALFEEALSIATDPQRYNSLLSPPY